MHHLLRLSRKALLLFGIYATVLAVVVIAGFLGAALGIWAAILWGVGILAGLALVARRRLKGRGLTTSPTDREGNASR